MLTSLLIMFERVKYEGNTRAYMHCDRIPDRNIEQAGHVLSSV